MNEDIFQLIGADYTFKKVFGTIPNKRYLIRFLNHFFKKYFGEIIDIEYLPTEYYGLQLYQKKVIFDIMCRDDKGNNFIIEMQHARQPEYADRSILYLSRAISATSERGAKTYKILPTYIINLVDFEIPEFTNKGCCVQEVFLKNQNNEILTTKVGLFYVFLRNFAADQPGVTSEMRTWMKLITSSNKMQESDYDQLDSSFKELLDECRISKLNDMEKEEYHKSILEYEDVQDAIAYAKEIAANEGREEGLAKGIEEGLAKGIEEGRKEGHIEALRSIALKLLKKGLSINDVIDTTGLSSCEVEKIASSIE